jgi:hypothetical protein
MGGLIHELLHDDSSHRMLQYCLLWWIPFLLLPFAAWRLVRTWRKRSTRVRGLILFILVLSIIASIVQISSRWSLAGILAPELVYPISVASLGCICLLGIVISRKWWIRLLSGIFLLPVVAVVALSFTDFILLFGMFFFPHQVGRLNSRVTWRTDWTSMSFTSDWVAYTVYTNPRWLPMVKHTLADDRCLTSDIVDGNPAIRIGADGSSVVVTCRQEDGSIENRMIGID